MACSALQPIPFPRSAVVSDGFTAAASSSATSCVALGPVTSGFSGPRHSAIAEWWNGTRWTKSQLLGGIDPQGVSCASASMCVAVGATRLPTHNPSSPPYDL